ncbi:MAG TPA: DNA repair protein RadA, partial [Thiolapillus brandeum]|nr:DNA repair protein RadA [Thiolapillus brandeum]
MAREKTLYVCRECGGSFPKWAGQCADCGAWNTLQESAVESGKAAAPRFAGYSGDAAAAMIRPLSN